MDLLGLREDEGFEELYAPGDVGDQVLLMEEGQYLPVRQNDGILLKVLHKFSPLRFGLLDVFLASFLALLHVPLHHLLEDLVQVIVHRDVHQGGLDWNEALDLGKQVLPRDGLVPDITQVLITIILVNLLIRQYPLQRIVYHEFLNKSFIEFAILIVFILQLIQHQGRWVEVLGGTAVLRDLIIASRAQHVIVIAADDVLITADLRRIPNYVERLVLVVLVGIHAHVHVVFDVHLLHYLSHILVQQGAREVQVLGNCFPNPVVFQLALKLFLEVDGYHVHVDGLFWLAKGEHRKRRLYNLLQAGTCAQILNELNVFLGAQPTDIVDFPVRNGYDEANCFGVVDQMLNHEEVYQVDEVATRVFEAGNVSVNDV